jgi:hypothetical protein
MRLVPANHYVLDGAVHGVVDTTGPAGQPAVSLTVDGQTVTDADVRETRLGIELTALLTVQPDRASTFLVLLLPQVNIENAPVRFSTIALLVTARDSIAGPNLVPGVVQHYEIRHVHGTASVVDTLTRGAKNAAG